MYSDSAGNVDVADIAIRISAGAVVLLFKTFTVTTENVLAGTS